MISRSRSTVRFRSLAPSPGAPRPSAEARPARTRGRAVLGLGLAIGVLWTLTGCGSTGDGDPAPDAPAPRLPAIEGPIEGPFTLLTAGGIDLASVGYESAEYFLYGTTASYTSDEALGNDGVWSAVEDEVTKYRTRAVVFRPSDPADFSGTVFVEWLNVSAGFDTSPDWQLGHVELLRRGHAYVAVSAQRVGVDSLRGNPRYADLTHPGDSFSYDIFSQAGRAVREDLLLDGLTSEIVIALGESQSASRMVTYVNAVDPLATVYDAFLVHSRGGGAAALAQDPQQPVPTGDRPRIRADARVPVLTLQTQTDVLGLGSLEARQPDSARFRLWEVAGASHADLYTLRYGLTDLGETVEAAEVAYVPSPIPGFVECDAPVNANPQHHYTVKAAMHALERWARDGSPPPTAPRLEVTGDPAGYALDAVGNVRGGIRGPWVDAPTARFGGIGEGAAFCFLFGTTVPLDLTTLATLYGGQADYESRAKRALDESVAQGFVLPDDRAIIATAIERSDLGLDVPVPEVEGPVEGGFFLSSTAFDLASVGYQAAEFFVSGTSRAFTSDEPLGDDGHWSVSHAGEAGYRTRIVVYRPSDPADFSGTVFVEWLNVSGGLDAAPDWTMAHVELIRRGHAWVGVSAQSVGIEGGGGIIPGISLHLKAVNPARYGSLHHPGDSFSYDLFAQVASALRSPGAVDPLSGLTPETLLAFGQSQSAARLVTYVDAIAPVARRFDGFLIHSRLGAGSALSQDPLPSIPGGIAPRIREDLAVPVLTVQSETDLIGLSSLPSRQPDTDRIRTWEIAGTAHADAYSLILGGSDTGDSIAAAQLLLNATPIPGIIECDAPINSAPQHHYGVMAGVRALDRWVRDGTPPASAEPLEIAGDPPAFVRDAVGNVRGGIRSPWVDAPTAVLSGGGQGGICFLFGRTELLSPAAIAGLYPDRQAFVDQALESLDAAVDGGFLLEDDAPVIEDALRQRSTELGLPEATP